jgi:3-keto-5-aminohexanoate cleavage enzyme
MAAAARQARDAGASVVHVHFRRQEPGLGHLPSWDPEVATAIRDAIRAECPDLLFNMTTGVVGPDISGPAACMRAIRPEIAACNAGSLNYLKAKSDGTWAWPPMLFDNPVTQGRGVPDPDERAAHRARVRMLRPRHRPLRRPLRRRRPGPPTRTTTS